jgi:hypothetical protein
MAIFFFLWGFQVARICNGKNLQTFNPSHFMQECCVESLITAADATAPWPLLPPINARLLLLGRWDGALLLVSVHQSL